MLPTTVAGRSKAQHQSDHETLHRLANYWATSDLPASVERVKNAGGGTLLLEPKLYTTPPFVLPRTPEVRLKGQPGTVVRGDAASFEEGNAIISWEAGGGHIWRQQIEGIVFDAPNVAGTKVIHHALTNATNWTEMSGQRLQIVLRDVEILCSNDYHEVLIDLEGCTWYSEFTNLFGNPMWGDNIYDTLLLKTSSNEYPFAGDAAEHSYMDMVPDAPGMFGCTLINLHSTWHRGGRSRMFEGRVNLTNWFGGFCDGGSRGPSYHFKESLQSNLFGLSCEGREEKPAMWLFENCANMQMFNCSHGSAMAFKSNTFGNGVEMRNCRDMQWHGKIASGATAIYSVQSEGKKAIVLDEDTRRCTFENWNVRAVDVGDEFEDNGTDNRIDYVRLHSGTEEAGSFSG